MNQSSRRQFVSNLSLIGISAYTGIRKQDLSDSANVTEDRNRPNITHGVASGDVSTNRAIIWSRTDRPAKMFVDISTHENFDRSRRVAGPNVLSVGDYTGKVLLKDLPAGSRLFYRVSFQDLAHPKRYSTPAIGQLLTAPTEKRDITFGWSGDTAGQGFGIDVERGGMKSYETMRSANMDFFVHSGDVCYADGPFDSEVLLDDGTTWKNLTTEDTSKVAETLNEFRGNFRYNLLDPHVRRFNAHVPTLAQWDDHETTNNWYPGEQLVEDPRYKIKSASLLAARAKQAFFEYMPIRFDPRQRIFRKIPYGPLLDLFFLDLRSYRGKNSENRQTKPSAETAYLGQVQISWLKKQLLSSQATWKFICSDMPLGLIVVDGENFETSSNGDGPALGRELEIADLLKFIKTNQIRNVVFITADVHYAASHYYNPNEAQFSDFDPFWEFVSGPLHAGTFGPARLDNTFGPQQKFCSIPDEMKQNRPPSDGLQFFGLVHIDAQSETAHVTHYNRAGQPLWDISLEPKTA